MTSELDGFSTSTEMHRRTLMKAAAWSVPVVAVAVATPARAASLNVADIEPLSLVVSDSEVAEWRIVDAQGNGVDDVTVSFTVLSGPLEPPVDAALSGGGGIVSLPQYSTNESGSPQAALVQVAAQTATEQFTLTVESL